MAILYHTDDVHENVRPQADKFTLEELHQHLGGYAEIVCRIGRYILLKNEEGEAKALNVNFWFPWICGPVLAVHAGEITDETLEAIGEGM